MPIIPGWELSSDRGDMFNKMMGMDPIGDPLLTSKCKLDADNGLLIVSETGFSWRLKMGMNTPLMSAGKSKWVRWHDIADIMPKKDGVLILFVKVRKDSALIVDKKGNPKIKKWRLILNANKNEDKHHFIERRAQFNTLMIEIFNHNKGTVDPPTSDSRI